MSDEFHFSAPNGEVQLTQEQQQQKMIEFAARLSNVPSYFTPVITVFVTPNGNIRLGFGDQLHPQLDPTFYTSVTIHLENARALRDQLTKMCDSMDAQIKAMQANIILQHEQQQEKPN